jgi:hypothetical protein
MCDIPEKIQLRGAMRFPARPRRAISSNLLTGTIVGGFVGIVVIALIWTSGMTSGPNAQSTQLSFDELALFGGSPSVHSLNSTCGGGAQIEVSIQNPSSENVTVQNIVIYGSGVSNATAYMIVSNSCLTIQEASPLVVSGGDYLLEGYVNAPIKYTASYVIDITFSNGQNLNQTVLAQS